MSFVVDRVFAETPPELFGVTAPGRFVVLLLVPPRPVTPVFEVGLRVQTTKNVKKKRGRIRRCRAQLLVFNSYLTVF